MRLCQRIVVLGLAVSFVVVAGMARAVTLPVTLNLTPADATYNRVSMALTLNPMGLGDKSQTRTSDASGYSPATFDFSFDPTSHLATATGIAFTYERPGHIAFTDTHFNMSWLFGAAGVTIDMTNVKVSAYTPPLPPSPPVLTTVSGGQFAATEQWAEFNDGLLKYQGSGLAGSFSGEQNLYDSPLGGQNAGAAGPGTIVISNPTMNGNVASYTVTVQMPLYVDETLTDPNYTGRVISSGTIKATGTFQYDFSPRIVYWNTASGDFNTGTNWDTGSLPRSVDTASIQNGGAATLSSVFPNAPAAVWVGNGAGTSGTLTIASGGALECSGMVLGNSGGTGTLNLSGGTLSTNKVSRGTGAGTLYLDGGTLKAKAASTQFLQGLSGAYVQAGGATIDSSGFDITVAQPLLVDAASSGGPLTKQGGGTMVLIATNTYNGGTTISAGTLQIGSGGTSGWISGDVLNNATLAFNRSSNVTFGGAISGSGLVVQAGPGTLALTGGNSYSGGTTVTGGVLQVSNLSLGTGTVTVNGGTLRAAGNITRASALSIGATGGNVDTNGFSVVFTGGSSGGGRLTKNGAGMLAVDGGMGGYGDLVVNAGTLRTSVGAMDAISAASIVTIAEGAIVDESYGNGETFGTLAGAGTFIGRGGPQAADEHLYIDLGANNVDTTFSGQFRAGLNGVVSPGGILSRFTKNGTGTLTLTGTSDYYGPVQINGGALSVPTLPNRGSDGPLGRGAVTGADISLGTASGAGTLVYTGSTGATDRAIGLQAGGGVVNVAVAGNSLTVSGTITGSGKLTKAGAGELTLTGSDTHTGGTAVEAGKLVIGSATALPAGHSLAIAEGTTVVLSSGLGASGAGSVSAGFTASPVPEPCTLGLLAAAGLAGGLCASVRRKRACRAA